MSKVVFPMTTPEFIDLQEQLCGPLDDREKEIIRIYARLIDAVYVEAVADGSEHYVRCVDTAKMVLAKKSISAAVKQFMGAFLELCREARIQGLRARGQESE